MRVVVVGAYPPTRCGIATFTSDVEPALRPNDTDVMVIPVSASPQSNPLAICRDDEDSYTAIGRQINELGCDVALIQYELGIHGGNANTNILALTAVLEVPYVVTLHTVLQRFSGTQTDVLWNLCRAAAAVTVFTSTARRQLLEQELVSADRLHVVANGVPPVCAAADSADARARFGLPDDVPVMSTFGLLSPGEGIELAIEVTALLSDRYPELHYVLAGRTNPEVAKIEGQHCRASLEEFARMLGVHDRVVFVDRFLDVEDLTDLLGISDIVCTPYIGTHQSVSGALTFSLAAGCAIASTPYRHARDVLAHGAALLSEFGDSLDLATSVAILLHSKTDQSARAAARRTAADMPWPSVGAAMRAVLDDAIRTPTRESLRS